MNGVIKAAVQEPPKLETSGVLNKNTGFPEPLSPYSNTTLPHPSADTSAHASIESADVPTSRTHSRHSSFQLPQIGGSSSRHKTRASLAGGPVGPAGKPHYDVQCPSGSSSSELAQSATAPAEQPQGQSEEEKDSENPRAGPERDEQGYREGERKKGVLRKMQLHKF